MVLFTASRGNTFVGGTCAPPSERLVAAVYSATLNDMKLVHNNTVIGTLAVDGWAVTFRTARRGLSGALEAFLRRCAI